MNDPERIPPPIFSSEQEQNKAECAAIWYTYAVESEQAGDIRGAHMGFYSSLKEQPEEIRYFQGITDFLNRVGHIEELIKVYEIGIQLHQDHIATLVNFSNLLGIYGFYERSREIAEQTLAKDSHCLPAWGNLGIAFRGLGDYERAKTCFEKILNSQSSNVLAGFNLGSVLLSLGDYDQGYDYYENRLSLPGYERLVSRNTAPLWQGESLIGKRILVYAEQGFGDTFMFGRFVSCLTESEGAEVVFEVQKPVLPLMQTLAGGKHLKCIGRSNLDDQCSEETDFQIPLLSLAKFALLQKWTDIPRDTYLSALEQENGRAQELLNGLSGHKVGLCWQGNPRAAIDCGRSIMLDSYDPLFDLDDCDFVSLQGRDGLEMVEQCLALKPNFNRLIDLDANTSAFAETSALIEGLDLVITTDTGIAHLAGALGKETWIILQKYPEWRWGLEGEDSEWYPKARLFRQEEVGDWEEVVQRLKQALQDRVEASFL